ncbi:MAG: hypothetical protein AB8G15_08050 [Saprospiraceae bacterium]
MAVDDQIYEIYQVGRAQLIKNDNVIDVGFGAKEVAGELTTEWAFRVYVHEKKSLEELSPEERIPEILLGYKTDILLLGDPVRACEDMKAYTDYVRGGIAISNLIDYRKKLNQSRNNPGVPFNFDLKLGTLGCLATIDGDTSKNNIAALTNYHVIAPDNAKAGSSIFNPRRKKNAAGTAVELTYDHRIGKILKLGKEENHNYAYPSEQAKPYYIDCASIKINTCISSKCDCNCGTNFKNEIRILNLDQKNNLTGIARINIADANPAAPTAVYKVGYRTGKSVGKIVDAFYPARTIDGVVVNGKNIIKIKATGLNSCKKMEFAKSGDSGSVVVNAQRQVVGLVMAEDGQDPTITYACHIHPVMDYLKITPITSDNAGNQAQSGSRNSAATIINSTENDNTYLESLQRQLSSFPQGSALLDFVEEHRFEVSTLVNDKRPVTLAWHRHKGPTYLAHFLRSSRDPKHKIPTKITGIYCSDLLKKMGAVLSEHGSPALQQAIAKHAPALYDIPNRVCRLEDFIFQYKAATHG